MLVDLKTVLGYAEEHKCAIGAFNTPNLESLRAALDSATEHHVPVIIAHAQLHEPDAPLSYLGPIMVRMAELADIPVCVHLDHGTDIAYIKRALDMGFTSCMYDGSLLPYEENVRNTTEVVRMAKGYHASVEGEIGVIGGRLPEEIAKMKPSDLYTKPEDAKDFVARTGIDALACGFGTVHGIYRSEPHLSFDTVRHCREAIGGKPIVMHGGSGVSPDDYRKAIAAGVRKINYYTYMSRAGLYAGEAYLKDHPDCVFFHEMTTAVEKAMREDVDRAINIFYNLG